MMVGKHTWAVLRILAASCVLVVFALVGANCTGTTTPDGGTGVDDPPAGATLPAANVEIEVATDGNGAVQQEPRGGVVTLTATPADGWAFAGWTGVESDQNPVSVQASEVTAVTAKFVALELDSDRDGVHDVDDLCPNTMLGCRVDETGCAANQQDTDGDGIPDCKDACAGTDPGAEVDAQGCAAGQYDADGDSIANYLDECPDTPKGIDVDGSGCAASERDSDDDGVTDDLDQCPGTGPWTFVDTAGCAIATEPAVAPPDITDSCVAGAGACVEEHAGAGCEDADCCGYVCDYLPSCCTDVWDETCALYALYLCTDSLDSCTATAGDCFAARTGAGCEDIDCCGWVCLVEVTCCTESWDADCAALAAVLCYAGPICGDGYVEYPEQCDDGNFVTSDGCDEYCMNEPRNVPNDSCSTPSTVTNGATFFSTIGTSTDGPAATGACSGVELTSDIWFCYTATCTDFVRVSLCASDYDTTLAVYPGCDCPTSGSAIVCDDDYCGSGAGSEVTFDAVAGQSYMIRVAGWSERQGEGVLEITCGPVCGNHLIEPGEECEPPDGSFCSDTCQIIEGSDVCGPGAGTCFMPNGTRGCDRVTCCDLVCADDPYCCEVQWDEVCAEEANELCAGL